MGHAVPPLTLTSSLDASSLPRSLLQPPSLSQIASVHPSSITCKLNGGEWRSPYVAYHECVRTTKIY
eukprot:3018135-Rhodomonas_salina.1